MINRLIPLVILLCCAITWCTAQTPRGIHRSTVNVASSASQGTACADQSAGTIEFDLTGFTGISNDVADTTKYLCFGDVLDIIHNGDADLTGDPAPATPAGIGYAFYTCRPTISGLGLDAILLDTCILDMPLPTTADPIWIAADDVSGNITLQNDGGLQNFFNNDDPVEIWFAPITYDNLVDGDTPSYENDGPCTNVNVDEAFSVVYLNEVTISNITPFSGGAAFLLEGGMSEFTTLYGVPNDIANLNYDVTVEMQGNPSVVGTPTNATKRHGNVISYIVPETGIYDITVIDSKGCGATQSVTITETPNFGFDIESINGIIGTQVCVDVTVSNFNDVFAMQYGIEFDPTVLEYIEVNPILANLPPTITASPSNVVTNVIPITWQDDTNSAITLPDNTPIFEVCFNVIGDVGECSSLTLVDPGPNTDIEILQINSTTNAFITFPEEYTTLGTGEICALSDNLIIDISSIRNECPGIGQTGGFSVSLSEGIAPYTISWALCDGSGPAPTLITVASSNNSNMFQGLQGGDYCVTVTDSSTPPQTNTSGFEIIEGPNLGVSTNETPVQCFGGEDGSVMAVLSIDGVVDNNPNLDLYNINWEFDVDDTASGVISLTDLSAGQVFVTVEDIASGCVGVASTTLTQNSEITVTQANLVNPSCPDETDGSIALTVDGGTGPGTYDYAWSVPGAPNGSVLSGLGDSTFVATITDDNGCTQVFDDYTLIDPPAIEVAFSGAGAVSCFETTACDGTITATATGGPESDYTFIWDSNDMASTAVALCRGEQTVTVTSGICSTVANFEITSPPQIEIDTVVLANTSCHDTEDGMISLEMEGGVAPYNYSWDPSVTTEDVNTISDLAAASYPFTITDANNCIYSASLTIGSPDELFVAVDTDATTAQLDCNGEDTGVISISQEGGTVGSLNFNWDHDPNLDNAVASFLGAGSYSVTMTDVNGCEADTTIRINEPAPVYGSVIVPEPPRCFGETTVLEIDTAYGGVGGTYTYTINNGVQGSSVANSVPLLAGEYVVTIFDNNGCPSDPLLVDPNNPSNVLEFTIENPIPIPVDFGSTEEEIELGEAYQLDAFFNGDENRIDTVIWSSPDILCDDGSVDCLDPTVSPVNTTTYSVEVYYDDGCVATSEILLRIDRSRNVYFPNVFSPDNDGINDVFTPFIGSGIEQVNFMRVFDRWGTLVHSQEAFTPDGGISSGWNGQYRNKTVNTGVYVYLVEISFIDGVTLLYRGDVTVLY